MDVLHRQLGFNLILHGGKEVLPGVGGCPVELVESVDLGDSVDYLWPLKPRQDHVIVGGIWGRGNPNIPNP